ncbi:MAG: hypothetical protein J2P25_17245 [Nocardiopsaceae bacterium]|nr:hypothetical protein [Nocardiopsaceae bacterium]
MPGRNGERTWCWTTTAWAARGGGSGPRQWQDPSFGRLFGKDRVYLRLPDDEGQGTEWLTEHGRDGRRLRQVELRADGTALTSDLESWPINPPFDLGDPWLAAHEISRNEFEQEWERGTPDPDW